MSGNGQEFTRGFMAGRRQRIPRRVVDSQSQRPRTACHGEGMSSERGARSRNDAQYALV